MPGPLIKIGTMTRDRYSPEFIDKLLSYGFESIEYDFEGNLSLTEDYIKRKAELIRGVCESRGVTISAISSYNNPLAEGEAGKAAAATWELLIKSAHLFGASVVCGFTGAQKGVSVADNIPAFKALFGRLSALAEEHGVKIAFENCSMGSVMKSAGSYNLAFSPDAWNILFDAVQSPNIGLEWEPAHQISSFIDPVAQLRDWAPKVFHIHGKDAHIAWDILSRYGDKSGRRFRWDVFPGRGDTDWVRITEILMRSGYSGSIDIEGWHDTSFSDETEYSGQVEALRYLLRCRGGERVPILEPR